MARQPLQVDARSCRRTAAPVFAAALAVRLIYAAQAWSSPLFQVPTNDADAYYRLALDFSRGLLLHPAGEPYWQPPFYPMALAAWMTVAGPSVLGIKLAQIALGSVNCVLVYLLGRRVLGPPTGLVAGLAAAFYGPLVYFDGELLTPTLQIFLNLCAVLLLMRGARPRRLPVLGAAGLVLGLSIITRPDTFLLLIAAAVWVAGRLGRTGGTVQAAAACALMLACAALPVVPVAVRNAVIGGDRVIISSNGGINFYIGNNPDEEKTRAIRPGPDWDALQALPKKDNPDATPSQQSAWFYRESLRYAAAQPAAYARLLVKKTVMYITAVEGRRNNDPYHYRQHSWLYAALMWRWGGFAFPFGVALPLAVFGLLACRRVPDAGMLYVYLGAQFVSVVAFFVCSRYRVPAAPVLLIFAASGGIELWRAAHQRRLRQLSVPLAIAVCVMVVSNLNLYEVDANRQLIDADTHLYLGHILENRGDLNEALEQYKRAVALNPRSEVSRFDLADLLARTGRTAQAKRQLLAALELNPRSPALNARLGEILQQEGDLSGANIRYARAAGADPMFAHKLVSLAEMAYGEGRYDLAAEALRAVVRIEPDWADARRSLGVALMKSGELEEAIEHLERACELDPGSAECFIALGLAYRKSGSSREAEDAFARAVRIGPEDEVRARIEGYGNEQRR